MLSPRAYSRKSENFLVYFVPDKDALIVIQYNPFLDNAQDISVYNHILHCIN